MVKWIRGSFESFNSKVSSKRLTCFCFMVLTTLLILASIRNVILGREITTNTLYFIIIMVSTVLLITTVISIENIIQLIQAVRQRSKEE